MITDPKELLDPQMISRLDALEVLTHRVFRGKQKGERRSRKKGVSIDFADYRDYVRGDDTRFIDVKLGPIDNPVLWGPSAVNVGNPHCIFFVEDAETQALDRFGPMIEHHPLFPERANVSVAQVTSRHAIRLRVWERGAGVTKACGTAACAVVVAANRRRLTGRKATVTLDGGDLAVEWREEDNRIVMTGPIELEAEGRFSDDF